MLNKLYNLQQKYAAKSEQKCSVTTHDTPFRNEDNVDALCRFRLMIMVRCKMSSPNRTVTESTVHFPSRLS